VRGGGQELVACPHSCFGFLARDPLGREQPLTLLLGVP
jgi:hypothetical protein